MVSENMGIGDLARKNGVKVVTIRYYEQIGILPAPPGRTATTVLAAGNMQAGSASFAGAGIFYVCSPKTSILCR